MSTKNIRAALKRLSDLEAEKSGCALSGLAHAAGQEVEAIEKAAKHYEAFGEMLGSPDELMKSIAEDAP